MTIEQFHPQNSTRAHRLYGVIKPYTQNGMRFLDLGCAYAGLAPLIHADFPKCQYFGFDSNGVIIRDLVNKHPYFRWECLKIMRGDELKNFVMTSPDVVIHIGVDADWSAIWKVHWWILQNKHNPRYIFLEAGRRDGYEGCVNIYNKIATYYIEHNFKLLEAGQFDFDYQGECLRDRRYSLLGKS